jgi:hypothetical protein
MPPPLPDEVQAAADTLGGVALDLSPSPHRFAFNVALAVPVFLGGAALIGLGLLGEVVVAKGNVWAIFVFHVVLTLSGFLLVAAAVVLPYRIRAHTGLRLLVCPDGLVRALGGEVGAVRWVEVTLVRLPRYRGVRDAILNGEQRLVIHWGEDGEWRFDDVVVPRFNRLRQAVQNGTLKHALPACQDALGGGETINFGPISAGPEGLTHGMDTLPWDEFQGYHAARGWITIKRNGARRPWRRLAVPDVDNAHVLLGLMLTRRVLADWRARRGGVEPT